VRKGLSIPILFLALLALVGVALGAKITSFNGVTADATDQVDYLVLGKGLGGNVTILFDYNGGGGYVLDSTNKTLVIKFAVNISSYSYSATGDTANLTVTRNPTNITFSYSGSSTVTVSSVNLTFNYSKGLSSTEGIDTGTVLTSKAVLAYVSQAFNTTYNETTTPEKVEYIVFDPATVYKYVANIKSVDGNFTTNINDTTKEIKLNLTKATTNKVRFKYTVTYSNALVPVYKVYYTVFLNNTYFTNILPVAVANTTDIGLKEYDGYTEVIFLDEKPTENSTFEVVAYAWDSNGTIVDGYKFKYDIDPIGGLPVTSEHAKNVSIIAPTALLAPPTPMYWWQYEYYGIPILGWIGIFVTFIVIAILVYRYVKGLPLIPSLKGVSSIVGIYMVLTLWAQITEWMNTVKEWASQNWIFVGILFVSMLLVLIASAIHHGTRE